MAQPVVLKPNRIPGITMQNMLIRKYPNRIIQDGTTYLASIHGAQRVDRTWEGWIEFQPVGANEPVLRTDQETSQPNLTAIEYWADGLEPIYFEGALARAQGRLP